MALAFFNANTLRTFEWSMNTTPMFMTRIYNQLQKPLKTFIRSKESVIIAWLQPCTTKQPIYFGTIFHGLYVAYYFWNFRMIVKKKNATIKTLSSHRSYLGKFFFFSLLKAQYRNQGRRRRIRNYTVIWWTTSLVHHFTKILLLV